MSIKITRAEISGGIFLKCEYIEEKNDRIDKMKMGSNAVIHPDLDDAFNALVPHFVLLSEMKKKAEVAKAIDLKQLDSEKLNKFHVKGVVIEDKKGVVNYSIFGFKILNTGKTISFETPKVKQTAEDHLEHYEFYDELDQAMDELRTEVIEYINGKQGIQQQAEIEFEGEFAVDADEVMEGVDFEKTEA